MKIRSWLFWISFWWVVSFVIGRTLKAQDLSGHVRTEILNQLVPITVNVSTHCTTTLEFPLVIEEIDSDGCTQKPDEEKGDFYLHPGRSWFSLRSLRRGAAQNLAVILNGKVYEFWIQTSDDFDFSVLCRFGQQFNRPIWRAPIKP